MTESPIISLSPNTNIQEIDKSNVPEAQAGRNIAMYVGEFEKGPINEPVFITSQLQFKQIFGRARDWNFNDWYQVFNYLMYSVPIWVCRTAGKDRVKANNNGIVVNSPGEWGNIITVKIYNQENYFSNKDNVRAIIPEDKIDGEYQVLVYRNDKLVEFFSIDKSEEMNSIYLESINLIPGEYKLENGYVSRANLADIKESTYIFEKDDYDIDIIIGNEKDNSIAISYAEYRKDCICFIGIPKEYIEYISVNDNKLTTEDGYIILYNKEEIKVLNEKNKQNIVRYIESLPRSQYCFFVLGIKQILDNFDSKKKLVNIAGDIAGLKGLASTKNPWSLGIGSNFKIKNYTDIRNYYSKEDKEFFYKLGVNTIDKNIILSEKMFIDAPAEYGLLSTRNTLNYIERACEKAMRRYVFGGNTKDVRGKIAAELKFLLSDIQLSGGFEAGKVHVTKDEKEEKIIINIYIKFNYLIHYVNLRVTNAGTRLFKEIKISAK